MGNSWGIYIKAKTQQETTFQTRPVLFFKDNKIDDVPNNPENNGNNGSWRFFRFSVM